MDGGIFEKEVSEARSTLRHELIHCIFDEGEIVAYAYGSREEFERCGNREKRKQAYLKQLGALELSRRGAKTTREKEYFHNAQLGIRAAFISAIVSEARGREAADYFLLHVRGKTHTKQGINNFHDFDGIIAEVKEYFPIKKELAEFGKLK